MRRIATVTVPAGQSVNNFAAPAFSVKGLHGVILIPSADGICIETGSGSTFTTDANGYPVPSGADSGPPANYGFPDCEAPALALFNTTGAPITVKVFGLYVPIL